MAKQNFLNGGYIGKLGDTVGQRWKNIKIIRTYVKPANPNTPAQQTARQQFAIANKLAQEAMNINGHTGVWDTSTKPEYSQRVGQAMRRLRLGYSERDSLPLYPEGQSPAVNVVIQDVSFEQVSNSYKFTVNSFQIQNPAAAEITFYTPLNYRAGVYGENIIHATVDSATNTFTVDLSATNTTDQQDVKTLFADAMELGFCAMTATFYDTLGATLNNVSIQRKYQVTDKLYDFDESLTLLDTTNKVSFTQAFTGNSISGAIIAQSSTGFPLVSKVSVQTTYYGGIAGETAGSQFITQNANAPQIFSVPVAAATGNLQETVATAYTLTAGATRPQLYKDSSMAQYAQPISKASVTGITFTGNTMLIAVDQNVSAVGAVSAQVSVNYGWVNTSGAFSVETSTLTGTIAQGGTSVSVSDAIVPRLAPAFVGSLSIDFKDNGGASITALNPDPVEEVAGKFYAATYTSRTPAALYATLLSGKSIGGAINASITNFSAFSANAFLQVFATVTYSDGQVEVLRGQELYDWGGTPASVAFTTTANANKEIRSAIIAACTIDPSDPTEAFVVGSTTVSVPSSVTTSIMTYDLGTTNITGTIPMTEIPFIKRIGGSVKAWEDSDGTLYESQLPTAALPTSGAIALSATGSTAGAWDNGVPIIWKPAIFYEDGTQCTTINVNVALPTATTECMIIQESSWGETSVTTLTANTSVADTVTFSSGELPTIASGSKVYGYVSTWTNEDGDDLVEIENPASSSAARSVTFAASSTYATGTAVAIGMSGHLVLYWVAGNTVNVVVMA